MENQYGPKSLCGRTKCAAGPPHLAGRHLDQRDELYDGPGPLLQVMPLAVRESARKIVRDAPELMPEVVDLAGHIQFLRDQVTHVQVDKDRKVREAMVRSESCEHHGEEIKALGEQLAYRDKAEQRAEAGRLALLGFLHEVDRFLDAGGRSDLTVAELVEAFKRATKRAHAAHARAWKS